MADGKWIAELTADTPLLEAARLALRARLRVVRDHLPLATEEMPHDPEAVHQLRVGTRRAGAALRIFSSCLPDSTAKKVKRRLRQIRQAAGDARDWDVFVLELLECRPATPTRQQTGLDYLLGYAAGQRAAAQVRLVEVGQEEGAHFEAFIDKTLDALRTPDGHADTLLTLARPLLAQFLEELEENASGDLNDYAHLHQVRIAGKHLRYAMELFAGCFEDSFKEALYPQVEEMQEILGRANDSHVATQRLETIRNRAQTTLGATWKRMQSGFTGLLQFHRRRLPRERRAFLTWWARWRKESNPAMEELLESAASDEKS